MSDSEPEETASYNSDEGSEYENGYYSNEEPNFDAEGDKFPTVEGDSDSEEGDVVVNPKIIIGAEIDDELDFGGADSEEEEQEEVYQTDGDEDPGKVNMESDIQSQPETQEDSSEEEDEEDEDDFKKFDREVIADYVDVYHPESRMHNYDEVRTMSSVVRGPTGDIIDVLHKTIPFLTKFEKAKIIGLRAKQLDEGAQPFVKVPSNVVTGYTISLMELEQKKIPFIIRRPIPGGGSEYWKVSDLELII